MSKYGLLLAGGLVAAGLVGAQAAPLPPERPDFSDFVVKVQDMDSGSTTVIKKRGLMGHKTTVIHRDSEPDSTGVVVHRREMSTDCRHVTVRKEDGMGNSVTKHKTKC